MNSTINYVTTDYIIQRVERDYQIIVNEYDAREWIFDAFRKIGANKAYILKVTDGDTVKDHPSKITIENYKGKLPSDIQMPVMARESDSKYPMLCTKSPFDNSYLLTVYPNSDAYTYYLNNHFMFTSFEEGDVELAYLAFPTDSYGYPKVPDYERFIEAIVLYIARKEVFKKWGKTGRAHYKALYEEMDSDWRFYAGGAKVQIEMPTIDEMEGLKNQWLGLLPRTKEHLAGFAGLNNRRTLNNINS